MKALVIYYSYSGRTRAEAQALAERLGADLSEVRDKKKPGIVGAFIQCISARGQKCTPVEPLAVDLESYSDIHVLAPVWAGFPAPAINNVLTALPRGAQVSVCLVSGSGKSSCREQVTASIRSRGCQLADWTDIKAEE